MAERADAGDVATQLEEAFTRLSQMETRFSSLEESVQSAVGSMMPKVEELLSRRGNANTRVSNISGATSAAVSSTSLFELAEKDDYEAILQFLIEDQTNTQLVHQRTEQGDTALHVAAAKGNLRSVQALLSTINVDETGYLLRTPLHCAAQNGHQRVAQCLLVAGATLHAKDADGKTAMALASEKVHTEMIAVLVRNVERPSIAFQSLSMVRSEAVEYLKQKGISIDNCNEKENTLLLQGARSGHWDVVEFLLKRGVSATKCGDVKECALVLAARDGQADVVRLLLRQGAASNAKQVEWGLCEAKNAAVVWAFMQEVPDSVRGAAGKAGLYCAARDGQLDALQALLDLGIDINCNVGVGHTTPLWVAANNGQTECLKELLRRGVDMNTKDDDGNTPLHAASIRGQEECVRFLLKAGAKRTENNIGKTPLAVASSETIRQALNIK